MRFYFRAGLRRASVLVLLMMLVIVPGIAVRAADTVFVSVAFDQYNIPVGRNIRLYISISNTGSDAIKSLSFKCNAVGSSIQGASISRLPDVIAAGGYFESEQYYRATSPGTMQVTCVLNAKNQRTGETFTVSSPVQTVEVSSETRLYVNASSASQVATVGQAVYLMVTYGNRGGTTFTNVQTSCPEQGSRALEFVSMRQNQTTLPPGQSGFVEYQLRAVRRDTAYFLCSVTATDSAGQTVTLFAPPVTITVK